MLHAKKLVSSNKIGELDAELFKTAVVFDTEKIQAMGSEKEGSVPTGECLPIMDKYLSFFPRMEKESKKCNCTHMDKAESQIRQHMRTLVYSD